MGGGWFSTPHIFSTCSSTPLPTDFDEILIWWRHKCKLSESPKKLTLRPLWRHLWRHMFKNFKNSKIHQNYIYEPICIIPVANERYWMIQQYYIAYLLFLCPWRHTMTSSNHWKFKIGYDVTKSVIWVGSQKFFFSWNPLPKTVILRYWSSNSVQKQKRYIQIRILITHRWRGVTFAFGGFYRA